MRGTLKLKLDKDLFSVNLLSALLISLVFLTPDSPLRTALGLPFILFFPGYTLICALFPKKKDLDGVERVALSIGLSLAVVPLIGLALNYTPWGIRLNPILVSLFLFTFSMSIATAYRRGVLPVEERFVPSLSINMPRWAELNKLDKLMTVGLIAGIVVVGGVTAYFVSMPRVGERFTEFYVLGSGGKIENYPTNLMLGESGTVILGVVNHEYAEVTYNIVIKLDNETIGTISNITLNNEMTWEENYTFAPEKTGDNMNLEFLLFREDVDEPYHNLHLWVIVRPRE
jgi:uncharacterized membrane protein